MPRISKRKKASLPFSSVVVDSNHRLRKATCLTTLLRLIRPAETTEPYCQNLAADSDRSCQVCSASCQLQGYYCGWLPTTPLYHPYMNIRIPSYSDYHHVVITTSIYLQHLSIPNLYIPDRRICSIYLISVRRMDLQKFCLCIIPICTTEDNNHRRKRSVALWTIKS